MDALGKGEQSVPGESRRAFSAAWVRSRWCGGVCRFECRPTRLVLLKGQWADASPLPNRSHL